MNEILLKISMRLLSTEVLIIGSVVALAWGTEHVQLALGGLLGYMAKEVKDAFSQ
jgi:hypothetical protein